MTEFLIGTSGWHYEDWQGRFYPDKLPKAKWLPFYAGRFATVELNNSFYRLPSEAAFTRWRDVTPAGFTFAVKASRFITHVKRLKGTAGALETFTSRARSLEEKLGPLLYQLPPGMQRDDAVLGEFLAALPPGLRHVIEFRHPSWLEEDVFAALRQHRAALCVFDLPGLKCPLLATSDFAYIRFHGSAALYSSSYSDEELAGWADRLSALGGKLKTVYIYFNNDVAGFALDNAATLRRYLEGRLP